ncbi:MAG: DUF4199 domain-containing protein [Bacteroidales bacterium]|jgi:hypothetical protein|nr:DUF4199 domain-containing protein [Bacteroidales bacterium]MCI2121879.1 DUF4199 domain-containing protein [Bacteroidales bacterium]MCI2145651.1 DUF4199 domain-containing protein [Bacteroidales bacterium]
MEDDFYNIPERSDEEKRRIRENRLSFWGRAATDGLYLSLVSIVLLALDYFVNLPKGLSIISSLVKIVASIWLLSRFMAGYSRAEGKVTYKRSFSFGIVTCLFSSILCAAFNFLVFQYLKPDYISNVIEQTLSSYQQAGMPIQQNMDTINDMIPMMPQYLFVFSFLWYTIIGLIASLSIAGSTKTVDNSPMSDTSDTNTDDEF